MYNKQLDTFIKVSETGSFSKAAEALYITPSAVTQQINILETKLNSVLFNRSNQGVSLTDAGEFLYVEVKKIIEKCNDISNQLNIITNRYSKFIRLGTGLNFKCRLFYYYWSNFLLSHTDYEVISGQFDYNVKIDDYYDIVEGINNGDAWQKYFDFLELMRIPIGYVVPNNHSLASKKTITLNDLKEFKLINFPYYLKNEYADMQDMLIKNDIKVINPEIYNESIFSICRLNNYIMLTPLYRKDLYPDFITIPADWNYTVSYGFHFNKKCNSHALEFIDFIKNSKNNNFQLY